IDDTECRRVEGLAASVGAGTVVSIVPAVAGG
ncbi:MAG TPA: molybdopterin synthase sulfur carrier subunit, partial [Acidimicrobiaceae bacterium]|nr:molybdopterin synthase sulfur carrier subunit [Acidimicrobiaceae bacterium]